MATQRDVIPHGEKLVPGYLNFKPWLHISVVFLFAVFVTFTSCKDVCSLSNFNLPLEGERHKTQKNSKGKRVFSFVYIVLKKESV